MCSFGSPKGEVRWRQGLLQAARELLDLAAGFDAALVTGEAAVVVAEQLAATEKACAAAGARAAARAASCRAHERAGFADAADWLARVGGSSVGEARAALSTVASSESCPATTAALTAGELSLAQARVIVGTEAECPGSEADLVALAGRSSLAALVDEARKRRLRAIAVDDHHRRQHRARELRQWRDELGMVRLSGALPPEVGVPIVNRLDAETDRIRRAERRDGTDEPRSAHAADALVAMVAGGGRPKATSAELVVVCDLGAFRRGHLHEGEVCHLAGGGPVPVEVARRVGADAFLKAVVHDGVRIDTVAHLGRHIPAELRTALELGPAPDFDGVSCVDEGPERPGSSTRWEIARVYGYREFAVAWRRLSCRPGSTTLTGVDDR